jgi:hypothetical protein
MINNKINIKDYDTIIDDTNCLEQALTCDEVLTNDTICLEACSYAQADYNNLSRELISFLSSLTLIIKPEALSLYSKALNQIVNAAKGVNIFNQTFTNDTQFTVKSLVFIIVITLTYRS